MVGSTARNKYPISYQKEINNGNIPAKEMIDGVMLLIAGAVLITPGSNYRYFWISSF